jgi:hypothetical protein
MRSILFAVATLVAGTLIGCSSVSVTTDYDPAHDFSNLRTFTIDTDIKDPNNVLPKDPLAVERVRAALSAGLVQRGMKEVPSGADLLVGVYAGVKEKLNVYNSGGGYGYRGYWGAPSTTTVTTSTDVTLFFDMYDTKEKKLVWRGSGTGALDQHVTPQEKTERINEAVNAILEDFPPRKK